MDQRERLAKLQALAELRRFEWGEKARPEQVTPSGDWNVWLILAGRGFGKTRTLAEDGKAYALAHPGCRIAIVAPTYADTRDTCVEGESGLLAVMPRKWVKTYNRSMGELVLFNDARFKCFSADEPDRLRGSQHHRALCDELAAWGQVESWDQLQFGMRLGAKPQVVVATTPRPTALIKQLVQRGDVHVTRGTTWDNRDNLAPAVLENLRMRYSGTRMGRQELEGQILEDVEGALWTRDLIRYWPTEQELPAMQRIVVAIDPAVTSHEESDETGIVVCGLGVDGRGYVLADISGRMSPKEWALRAVNAYRTLRADRIVAEANNGGDMVEMTLRTVDPNVAYTKLHASRGKITRAEPIASLYEQGRVWHAMEFADLEAEQCNYVPDSSQPSPDRMDALVWGLTELMLESPAIPSSQMMVATHRMTS